MKFTADLHDERWLHDIDPPASHRGVVVAMFATVVATVALAVIVGLGLQHAIAAQIAVLVSR